MLEKELKYYPILHRFLARLYKECDIYETDDMFEHIKDDIVVDYCKCNDIGCSTVYVNSDRYDSEDEFIETYNSHKGLLVLHFSTGGDIEIEALEGEYPFREELRLVFNGKSSNCSKDESQKLVDGYFNTERTLLATVIVD